MLGRDAPEGGREPVPARVHDPRHALELVHRRPARGPRRGAIGQVVGVDPDERDQSPDRDGAADEPREQAQRRDRLSRIQPIPANTAPAGVAWDGLAGDTARTPDRRPRASSESGDARRAARL